MRELEVSQKLRMECGPKSCSLSSKESDNPGLQKKYTLWVLCGKALASPPNLVLNVLLRTGTALPQVVPLRFPLQNMAPRTGGAHSAGGWGPLTAPLSLVWLWFREKGLEGSWERALLPTTGRGSPPGAVSGAVI